MIRHARGAIDYVGDTLGNRGREEWLLTVHEDGSRTLRAHCEMWDTGLERDVAHTVSAAFRPLRSFISQRTAAGLVGEGWFDFGEDNVRSAQLVGGERTQQQTPLMGEPDFFVPHSVSADAWIVPAYDRTLGGVQELERGWRSSPRANGSTGPVAEPMGAPVTVTLLAEERITVPAGTFDTLHFAIEQRDGKRDELWTSTEDYLLVQLRCDVLESWYRLSELTVGTGPALRPNDQLPSC